MISSLNDLRIVETRRLILHEAHDAARLDRLRSRVASERFQQNPVIVSAFGEKYLVLDGAHRVKGLEELGCRFVLVQVVEPPDVSESWAHVLGDVTPQKVNAAGGVPGTGDAGQCSAVVEVADGESFLVGAGAPGLDEEVAALWDLQSLYPEQEVVRRVGNGTPVALQPGEALVRYRSFAPKELAELVETGSVLPAGITRFRVPERVLGIRFPLEKLKDGNLEDRNRELESFVAERWEQNRIRYYGEPVVLFE